MAAFDAIRPASAGLSISPVAWVGAAFAKFVAWNDRRATRRALSKLSDHELADIGMCRGDIDNLG